MRGARPAVFLESCCRACTHCGVSCRLRSVSHRAGGNFCVLNLVSWQPDPLPFPGDLPIGVALDCRCHFLSRVFFSPILCSSMSDWWRVMPIEALAKKNLCVYGRCICLPLLVCPSGPS